MLNHTNNMPGRLDPGQATYSRSHRLPIQALQYSPPSPNLPGFTCNIGAPSHHDSSSPHTKIFSGRPLRRASVVEALVYPSPPPSSSEPKRSVPLPSETESIPSSKPFGGVLDSPLIMKHEALRSNLPISPPATLPTQTQELPPTEHEASIDIDLDPLDSPFSSALDAGLTPLDTIASNSHLLSPLSPVSPVSPQWDHNRIPYLSPSPSSRECFLLSEHHPPELFSDAVPPFRPNLKLLDIPLESYAAPSGSWHPFSPPSMDIEMTDPFGCPLSIDWPMFDDSPSHDFQNSPHPSSPSIQNILSLPDLDDDPSPPNSPSSPSLRSFSSLPGDDDHMLISPKPSLLALPGAVLDDDLLPAELGLPTIPAPEDMQAPTSPPSSRSLLLLDDPNDVPPPRSPSPENFDLDPSLIAGCSDPDLQRLYEFRTRSQASERASRQLEVYMLEQGSRYARAEARNARRKEKERSREVSALLRLKLDERGVHVGDQQPQHLQGRSARKMIDSMAQLVAKMMFRRHDTSRPLANKLPTLTKVRHPKSPLSRSITLAELEEDEGWPEQKPIWTLGFEQSDPDQYLISPIHF